MWKKLLGLAAVTFLAFGISGCASRYPAHGYRGPGYVHERGRHYDHHKHHKHDRDHDRDYDRR